MPEEVTNNQISAQIEDWRQQLNGRVGRLEQRADANDARWTAENMALLMTNALGALIADPANDATINALRLRIRREQRDAWRDGISRWRSAVLWLSPVFQFVILLTAVLAIVWGFLR